MGQTTGECGAGFSTYQAAVALKRYRRVKLDGTLKLVYANAGEDSIGTLERDAEANDWATVKGWDAPGNRNFIANGAIAAGATVYGAVDGKVSTTVSGNKLGVNLYSDVTLDGHVVTAQAVK